jgi:spore coat protein U-like protein
MRTLIVRLVLVLAVFSIGASAYAQCSWVVNPTTMDFGTYSVFGGATNATTATGSIRCTGNLVVTVSSTTGGSGTYAQRRMNGVVNYQVYIDAGRTMVWGNATGGTSTYTFVNNGGPNTYSGFAYGQVPGGQDLAPGLYTDTLNVTLSFRPTSGGATTNLAPLGLGIRMTVVAECRADVFNLTFGNYSPLAVGALNQSSQVRIYCTRSTPATFTLNAGANALGAQKRMRSGTLYLDYTATLASGSGTSTSTLVPIGNGINLAGSIPAAQDATASATPYTDTLQVVINY